MAELLSRFGVSIEKDLLEKFDKKIHDEGYTNRSEAIRDLIRKNLIEQKSLDPMSISIATLTMVYDHHTGNLTENLLKVQHDHTNEILSTTHFHIDHTNCLEVIVLKGKTKKIKNLADSIKSIKGIKHGELVITSSSL